MASRPLPVEIVEIVSGLWLWRAEHPGWRPGQGWRPVVASACVESGGETLLLDPPRTAGALRGALGTSRRAPADRGRRAEAGPRPRRRRVRAALQRPGAGTRSLRPARIPDTPLQPIHPGNALPGGLGACDDGRWRNETPLRLPEQRALVFADALTAPHGELRVWATPWHERRVLPVLGELLDLPFEIVIVSHSAPVHPRIEFERALDRSPWAG